MHLFLPGTCHQHIKLERRQTISWRKLNTSNVIAYNRNSPKNFLFKKNNIPIPKYMGLYQRYYIKDINNSSFKLLAAPRSEKNAPAISSLSLLILVALSFLFQSWKTKKLHHKLFTRMSRNLNVHELNQLATHIALSFLSFVTFQPFWTSEFIFEECIYQAHVSWTLTPIIIYCNVQLTNKKPWNKAHKTKNVGSPKM